MRNLSEINPRVALPRNFAAIAAVLPLMMTAFGAVIARDATPDIKIRDNPLAVVCLTACVSCVVLIFIPLIFKWDWRAKYFGAPLIYIGGPALLGIVPWLCLISYGTLSLTMRMIVVLGYVLPIFLWCRRFVKLYQAVFADFTLRNIMLSEEADAIYYLQKGDKWLIEKKFRFRQTPPGWSFVLACLAAALSIPFASQLSHFVGLPYIHILLAIVALPVTLMCLGMAVRGYLIFYFHPWKLKRILKKDTYVDMDTKPDLSAIRKQKMEDRKIIVPAKFTSS